MFFCTFNVLHQRITLRYFISISSINHINKLNTGSSFCTISRTILDARTANTGTLIFSLFAICFSKLEFTCLHVLEKNRNWMFPYGKGLKRFEFPKEGNDFSLSLCVLVSFWNFAGIKSRHNFDKTKELYLYRQLDANESNTLEMEVWPLNKLAQLQPHLKPCGRCVCRAIGIIKPKYSMPMHSLRQLDFGRAPLWCCVTNRISLTRITYQKYASILLRCFAVSYTQNTSIHNSPYRNRNRKHFKIKKSIRIWHKRVQKRKWKKSSKTTKENHPSTVACPPNSP